MSTNREGKGLEALPEREGKTEEISPDGFEAVDGVVAVDTGCLRILGKEVN